MGKPILCIDFDGVLNSYTSGWKGPCNIPDEPVKGAIEWLQSLLGWPDSFGVGPRYLTFKVAIFSTRSQYSGGRRAMRNWLVEHGLDRAYLELIDFPVHKPPAFLQIDDRAITFKGKFPTVKEMKAFKPWNK